MGKVIFWLVVIFGALFVVRLVNAAKSRAAKKPPSARPPPGVPMVRCSQCGVFLPRADATPAGEGFRCTEPRCSARR